MLPLALPAATYAAATVYSTRKFQFLKSLALELSVYDHIGPDPMSFEDLRLACDPWLDAAGVRHAVELLANDSAIEIDANGHIRRAVEGGL